MRFILSKLTSRFSLKHPKKTILGTLKDGTKLVAAGLLRGSGAEIVGHISRKAQEAEDGAQYITITDLGPSIACFDSVEANTDGSCARWLFGTQNPFTFGIPTFLLVTFIVLT